MHRFCELSPSKAAPGEDSESQKHNVEPEFLQLAFHLGEDEDEGFPQVTRKAETAASFSFLLCLVHVAAFKYIKRRQQLSVLYQHNASHVSIFYSA